MREPGRELASPLSSVPATGPSLPTARIFTRRRFSCCSSYSSSSCWRVCPMGRGASCALPPAVRAPGRSDPTTIRSSSTASTTARILADRRLGRGRESVCHHGGQLRQRSPRPRLQLLEADLRALLEVRVERHVENRL